MNDARESSFAPKKVKWIIGQIRSCSQLHQFFYLLNYIHLQTIKFLWRLKIEEFLLHLLHTVIVRKFSIASKISRVVVSCQQRNNDLFFVSYFGQTSSLFIQRMRLLISHNRTKLKYTSSYLTVPLHLVLELAIIFLELKATLFSYPTIHWKTNRSKNMSRSNIEKIDLRRE